MDIPESGLNDKNNDIEDQKSYLDTGPVEHAPQGVLEGRLGCAVELKDETFERVCVEDWNSPPNGDDHLFVLLDYYLFIHIIVSLIYFFLPINQKKKVISTVSP